MIKITIFRNKRLIKYKQYINLHKKMKIFIEVGEQTSLQQQQMFINPHKNDNFLFDNYDYKKI